MCALKLIRQVEFTAERIDLEDFQGPKLVKGDLSLILEIITTCTRFCELKVGITGIELRFTVLIIILKFHLSLYDLNGISSICV